MKSINSILAGATWTAMLVLGVLCCTAPSSAADVEVSVLGGGNTMNGGIGSHALVGANAGFRLGEAFHVFGEASWSELASTTMQTTSGSVTATATGAAKLASFGGGIDYGLKSSKRVEPYVVTAFGVGHFYVTGSGSTNTGITTSVSLPLTNSAYFAAGGGLRFFVGKKWGFKPEVRYQRYDSSILSANSVLYTVGLFWRFGDR